MFKIKNTNICFYAASISLHGALFLFALIFLNQFHEVPRLGNTSQQMISSYMYVENKSHSVSAQSVKAQPVSLMQPDIHHSHSIALKMDSHRRRTDQPKKPTANNNANNSASSTVSTHQTGEQTQRLLALLHTAIQNQQQYPLSAMEMERQGKTTIKFILLPSGRIEQMHMVRSSGTDSLDQAALAAVQNAAPFIGISQYLAVEKEFSLDVVFELA